MAPAALARFVLLLRVRVAARVDLLRKCRRGVFGSPSQAAPAWRSTANRALRDSLLDNEAAMRSYAKEVDLNRVRNLSSEDRRALARARSSTVGGSSDQERHTIPRLFPTPSTTCRGASKLLTTNK